MPKRPIDTAQYRLSALPNQGRVCALGNAQTLRELMQLDGAEKGVHPKGTYVSFIASRHSIMAAEAAAAPVFVAPEYTEMRRTAMSVPPEALARWRSFAPPLGRPLLRHQEEFCALAYDRPGMLNASEQGTGKTATAIALCEAWEPRLTVVVVPKSIMWQWHGEFHQTVAVKDDHHVVPLLDFSVEERIEALHGLMAMGGRLTAIVNYEVLDRMRRALIEVAKDVDTVLVLDECWRVMHRQAAVTQAATALRAFCSRALGLTGTPIGQGVANLWSQLRVVEGREPPDMETFVEWCDSYEKRVWVTRNGRSERKVVGCKNPVGMMRRLEPVFYRATKASCLDLPEKLPTVRVALPMPPEMRRVYDDVKEDGEAALGCGDSLMGERTTTLRLQQIVGGFVFNPDGTYTEEEAGQPHDLRLRLLGSPKVDWCLDFARDQLLGDPTYRALFWFKFNAEVMHMRRRLAAVLGEGRVAQVLGGRYGTSDAEMERIKASLNSRSELGYQCACAQVKKMAYGHNMQGVDHNVYYSHTWSHVEKSQSADRSHRMGRVGPVAYTELVVKGSVDEVVLAATDGLRDLSFRLAPDTVGWEED